MSVMTIGQAIRESMCAEMRKDDKVYVMGEMSVYMKAALA